MVNAQLYPLLEQVKDAQTRAAIRKLWEVFYANQNQLAAAFNLVSPSTQTQVLQLLGLQ
jgi:hypothetical protein